MAGNLGATNGAMSVLQLTGSTGATGQAWGYVGVPYPTYTNATLEALGYTKWPYDPCTIEPPALPNPWNSNQTDFYYVQKNGTNVNEGYPGDPRGSFPTSPAAGSVIVVSDGNGNNIGAQTVSYTGSTTDPIFIVAAEGETPTFTGALSIGGSYVVVDGLTVTGNLDGAFTFNGGSHMCMRGCSITDTNTTSGGCVGLGTDHDHCLFYNNTITGTDGTNDVDHHGISLKGAGTDVWIIGNTFTGCNGDGVQVGDQQNSPTEISRGWIAGNTVTVCKQAGLWLKNCTDFVVSQNTIHSLVGAPGNTLVSIGGQYDFSQCWFIANTVYNHDAGMQIASTGGATVSNVTQANPGRVTVNSQRFANGDQVYFSGIDGMTELNGNTYTVANIDGTSLPQQFDLQGTDTSGFTAFSAGANSARVVPDGRYILGNLIYDMDHRTTPSDYNSRDLNGWIAVRPECTNTFIEFNTGWNCDRGMHFGANAQSITCRHNLIPDPTDSSARHMLLGQNITDLDYNYWDGATQDIYDWNNNLVTVATIGGGHCTNAVTGTDPGFEDEASDDFRLAAGSACIDQGATTSQAFTNFNTRYGFKIEKDLIKNPRPVNTNFDIGAYERQ